MDDLLDDPELKKIHEQRIEQLKSEQEKRQLMNQKGHGEITDVSEGDFLGVRTCTAGLSARRFNRDESDSQAL